MDDRKALVKKKTIFFNFFHSPQKTGMLLVRRGGAHGMKARGKLSIRRMKKKTKK